MIWDIESWNRQSLSTLEHTKGITTEEISYHFKNFSDLSDNQKLKAISILSESDKIKFAKAEVDSHYDLIDPVIRFIKDTPKNKASSEEISSKY